MDPARGRVLIDEDCWIGKGVFIRHGVHVGRGALIGANAVVTRSVAPYSVVAGVPASPIGERLKFDPPREIQAEDESHRPYFYAGFFHDPSNDPQGTDRSALWAGRYARLVMFGPARRLQLELMTAPVVRTGKIEIRVNNNPAATVQPTEAPTRIMVELAESTSAPNCPTVVELIVTVPPIDAPDVTAGYIEPVAMMGVRNARVD